MEVQNLYNEKEYEKTYDLDLEGFDIDVRDEIRQGKDAEFFKRG
jgi:hypothetical protein